MRFKFVLCLASSLLIAAASPVSAQLKKVRFSVSAASIAEVPSGSLISKASTAKKDSTWK